MHKWTIRSCFGRCFRRTDRSGGAGDGAPADQEPAQAHAVDPLHEATRDAPGDRPASGLGRWLRRNEAPQPLQETCRRLAELLGSLEKHLAAQDEQRRELLASFRGSSQVLEQLSRSSRQQIETLDSIGARLDTSDRRAEELAAAISECSGSFRAQADALAAIRHHAETGSQTQGELLSSLRSLGEAIVRLGKLSEPPQETMERLGAAAEQRDRDVRDLVHRQGRKLTMLLIATLILAALALAGAVVNVWFLLSRGSGMTG